MGYNRQDLFFSLCSEQSPIYRIYCNAGHGEGFCIGNIIKYAQRYGKKGGFNRNDLTKVAHYVIIMLYLHDNFYKRETQGEHDEVK